MFRPNSVHFTRHKLHQWKSFSHSSIEGLILKNTAVTNNSLTPEVKLRLITRETEAWHTPVVNGIPHPLGEPFWAFYWPGGQGISRYILDHPEAIKGKRVLDFGCGSGVNGITAIMCGASETFANDTDPMALVAAKLNAELNGVKKLGLVNENLLGTSCEMFDVVLIGDMMYDPILADSIFKWSLQLTLSNKTVLIGDPGRLSMECSISRLASKFFTVGKYELDHLTREDNSGFSCAFVYRLL